MNYLVNDQESYQLPQQSKRILKIARKSAKQNKIQFNVKDMLDYNNGKKRKQLNIQRKRESQRLKDEKILQAKKEQQKELQSERQQILQQLRDEMKKREQHKFKSISQLKEEINQQHDDE